MKKREPKMSGSRNPFALLVPVVLILLFAVVLLVESEISANEVGEVPVTQAPVTQGAAAQDILEVRFLDVGQGDSILIRIPNGVTTYVMLIDSGEKQYAEGLIDYLTELGVDHIDVLVNTHPHADHMGAMADVIDAFDIGEMYMPVLSDEQVPTTRAYENLLDAILAKGMKVNPLYEDVYIDIPGGAQIDVYWPLREGTGTQTLNNISGVFRLSYGDTSFLFTGDAEEEAEQALVQRGVDLSATVLKCGHHGSATSTTYEFLHAVQPQLSVISCGADNSYGHPSEQTLSLLEDYGCEVYRTDRQGTIVMESTGSQITVTTDERPIKTSGS